MEDIDIWRAAQQLIKTHGADAALMAAQRADALLSEGAVEGSRTWEKIVAAINELQREKPNSGERPN
jgi:triphosphoribosyl-dephospho-CoA synthetase